MKKILSLVLVLSMVLGSFGFAFAAEELNAESAGEMLKAMGLLEGDNGDLMLDKDLKRQDMIVVVSRLLGEGEDAKNYPLATNFPDVRGDEYKAIIGWAQSKGITTDGMGDGTFGFDGKLELRHTITFLLRALGYDTEYAWDNHADLALELGWVAEGLDLKATTNRGVMAQLMVNALYTPMFESEVTLGTFLGYEGFEIVEEVVELAVEAKAVKANEVEVTFNKAVETATFTVKRGAFAVNSSEIKWNDAKTVATIKTVNNMTAGDYTVTAVAGEETATAEFKVETQKVAGIEFTSDKAVLGSKLDAGNLVVDNTFVTIGYKLVDQYGVDVTSARKGEITWSTTTGSIDATTAGVLKLTGATFTLEQKLIVNGLNTTTGVFASETFTVSPMAHVADVQFGELTLLPNEKATAVYTDNVDKFYIPVKAFDQYGNAMVDETIVAANLLPLHVNVNATLAKVNDALRLTLAPAATPIPGDAHITFVGKSSGARFATTFTMNKPVTITEFSMEMPALIVAGDAKAIEIPFVALDQYGNAVTDEAELNALIADFSITASKGAFSFARDYKTNTVKLYLDTVAATEGKAYVTLVTPGHKFFQTSYDVQKAAKPVIVSGTDKLVSSIVEGSTLATIKATNLVLVDQYGRKMAFDNLPAGYDVRLTASASPSITLGGVTTFALKTDVATITTNKTGATTVKATIFKDGVEVEDTALSFTMNVVQAKDVVSYEITEVPTIKAGEKATLIVTGKLANGTEVVLNTAVIKEIVSSNTDIFTVNPTTREITALGDTSNPNLKDATAAVIVTIEGPNGAILATKDVTVSYQPSAATTIKVAEVTYIKVSDAKVEAKLRAAFEVKDQYGANYTDADTLVITNATNAAYKLTDLSTAVAGDEFNLIFIAKNGKSATTKVVVIQD